MNHKDRSVYRAAFSGLKLEAFGRQQLLAGRFTVTVRQVKANPPLWRGGLDYAKQQVKWESDSREGAFDAVGQGFSEQLTEWHLVEPDRRIPPRLSPAPPAPDEQKRA